MGQDLFYEPSVFSYFSPLYAETGGPAPEFQIYSTQTAAERADVVNTDPIRALDKSTTVDLTPFLPRGSDVSAMVDYSSYVFLHQTMSTDLRAGRDGRGQPLLPGRRRRRRRPSISY